MQERVLGGWGAPKRKPLSRATAPLNGCSHASAGRRQQLLTPGCGRLTTARVTRKLGREPRSNHRPEVPAAPSHRRAHLESPRVPLAPR